LEAAEPEPEAIPRVGRRRVALLFLAAGVIGLTLWSVGRPSPVQRTTAAEPSVRIGEHLLYKLAPEETMRAVEQFQRAIAANPGSASGHAGLSISLLTLSMLGVQSLPEVLSRADRSALRALELGPNSSTAHYAAAMLQMIRHWDFKAADSEFRRALELDPESVQTRLGYGRLKLTIGDPAGALALVEEALRLDPASPPLGMEYCRLFYYLRDFRRAESECRKVLDRERSYALAHYFLGLSLGWLNRLDAAQESLDRSGLMPGVLAADRAWLRLRAGDRRPAQLVLEDVRELVRRKKVDASATLLLATLLNRMDEAYEALDSALADKAPELLVLHVEPRLDSLRSDPRYPAVLRRIGAPIAAKPVRQ
jgi:tetratricopeptide (TPR) repeat protein